PRELYSRIKARAGAVVSTPCARIVLPNTRPPGRRAVAALANTFPLFGQSPGTQCNRKFRPTESYAPAGTGSGSSTLAWITSGRYREIRRAATVRTVGLR